MPAQLLAGLWVFNKMGCSRVRLGLVLLLWSCAGQWLKGDTEDLWNKISHLHCGVGNMELTFPLFVEDVAFSLMVLDFQGEPHGLGNNSVCGLWVGQRPNDSMIIGAAYDGCYVTEKDGDYVMTLVLEKIFNGAVEQYKFEKKCPVMNVSMDAPSPSLCSAVSQVDKLSCASVPVSREVCEEVGCCFSPADPSMPCYYGNKSTAQCTSDNYMVIAVSKDLTVPSLILNSVSVVGVDASCEGFSVAKSNSFVVFRFPLSCGGQNKVNGSPIIYESTIEGERTTMSWQGSTITRDSTMRLTVRCSYSHLGVAPVQVHVSTLPPPLPVSTSGPLFLEMRIAKVMDYMSYFSEEEYPVTKVLREPVYLEVHLLGRTDPALTLIVNDCWATNSVNPTHDPQWPILLDSCPFDGDNYITQLVPVVGPTQNMPFPTHYKRFIISTFTFVDTSTQQALGGLVYFHCSASVCVRTATDNCMTNCKLRKRRMAKHIMNPTKSIVTSDGPVQFLHVEKDVIRLEGHLQPGYSTLDMAKAIAAAGGVASVTGIVLGLWLLHRRKSFKKHNVQD